jgi:hypothetical protein
MSPDVKFQYFPLYARSPRGAAYIHYMGHDWVGLVVQPAWQTAEMRRVVPIGSEDHRRFVSELHAAASETATTSAA